MTETWCPGTQHTRLEVSSDLVFLDDRTTGENGLKTRRTVSCPSQCQTVDRYTKNVLIVLSAIVRDGVGYLLTVPLPMNVPQKQTEVSWGRPAGD